MPLAGIAICEGMPALSLVVWVLSEYDIELCMTRSIYQSMKK
jgi:hypothetical protein